MKHVLRDEGVRPGTWDLEQEGLVDGQGRPSAQQGGDVTSEATGVGERGEPRPRTSVVERHGGVMLLRMNRPERHNAVGGTLFRDLAEAFDEAGHDDAVHVVVTTGVGDSFCVGADVADFARVADLPARELLVSDLIGGEKGLPPLSGRREEPSKSSATPGRWALRMWALEKPTIAAINGTAVGGGFGVALLHDIRVAAESARLGGGFAAAGLAPELGMSLLLPQLVGASGRGRAALHRAAAARRGRASGWHRLRGRARRAAARAGHGARRCRWPPCRRLGLRLTKRLLRRGMGERMAEQLRAEYAAQVTLFDHPRDAGGAHPCNRAGDAPIGWRVSACVADVAKHADVDVWRDLVPSAERAEFVASVRGTSRSGSPCRRCAPRSTGHRARPGLGRDRCERLSAGGRARVGRRDRLASGPGRPARGGRAGAAIRAVAGDCALGADAPWRGRAARRGGRDGSGGLRPRPGGPDLRVGAHGLARRCASTAPRRTRLTVVVPDGDGTIVHGDRRCRVAADGIVLAHRSRSAARRSRRRLVCPRSPRARVDASVDDVLRPARVAVAADLVGVAAGALDRSVRHALDREQFGRKIGPVPGRQAPRWPMSTSAIEACPLADPGGRHRACRSVGRGTGGTHVAAARKGGGGRGGAAGDLGIRAGPRCDGGDLRGRRPSVLPACAADRPVARLGVGVLPARGRDPGRRRMSLDAVAEFAAFLGSFLPGDYAERYPEYRKDQTLRAEYQAAAFDSGWLMPEWEPELGGHGLPLLDALAVRIEGARRQVPRILNVQGAGVVAPALRQFGTPAQKERLLRPVLRGEEWWALGMSEPGSGSDLASLRTSARREERRLRRQRAEDLDDPGAPVAVVHAVRAHRPRGATPRRHLLPHPRSALRRSRRPADPPRRRVGRRVLRDFPRRRPHPGREPAGPAERAAGASPPRASPTSAT